MTPPAETGRSAWPRVALWRTTQRTAGAPQCGDIRAEHIFPSGRQALSEAARRLGLGRPVRIALPEWSSACVIAAAGESATPIPMREMVAGAAPAAAILVYDQWGWPRSLWSLLRLSERFPEAAILLDRVDTPSFGNDVARTLEARNVSVAEIWSLSKTLGLPGGGLLRIRGGWISPVIAVGDTSLAEALSREPVTIERAHILKSLVRAVPDSIAAFVRESDVSAAFAQESAARQTTVAAIADSELANGWMPWMRDALSAGAAPGIAPLGRGQMLERLASLRSNLRLRFGIDTEIYNFDFAGDPIEPRYEPCLAFPTHGEISTDHARAAIEAQDTAIRNPARTGRRPRSAVVVGGGIAGMVAARLLAERYENVTLVERSEALGGLMQSVECDGFRFDRGTHFASTTGLADLDRILFEDMDPDAWHEFRGSLREGHYFRGRLNTQSGCLDATTLEPEILERGLAELVCGEPVDNDAKDLDSQLRRAYGPTFTDEIFAPVLGRLYGAPLDTLAPNAHQTFSASRLIAVARSVAVALKQAPRLDDKLAHGRFSDGRSTIVKYYPKKGGVGCWIDDLAQALRRHGVQVMTGRGIKSIKRSEGRAVGVVLDNGTCVTSDLLAWTAPPATLLRAADVPLDTTVPRFRNLILCHMVFDAPVKCDLHWVCCYDPGFLSYRITLYPNITAGPAKPAPHHLTVEMLADTTEIPDDLPNRLADELRRLGIVGPKSKPTHSTIEVLPNAMPVATIDHAAAQARQVEQVAAVGSNVVLLGRATGAHFMAAILREVYDALACERAMAQP